MIPHQQLSLKPNLCRGETTSGLSLCCNWDNLSHFLCLVCQGAQERLHSGLSCQWVSFSVLPHISYPYVIEIGFLHTLYHSLEFSWHFLEYAVFSQRSSRKNYIIFICTNSGRDLRFLIFLSSHILCSIFYCKLVDRRLCDCVQVQCLIQ